MTLQQFVDKYKGKTKGYPTDSSYPGECLSIVKLYIEECFDIKAPPSGSGSAYGYWKNFPDPLGTVFRKVNRNTEPIKRGDIPVWLPTDTNPFGHIDIFLNHQDNGFLGFDQNWGKVYAHKQFHNWNGVVGWLTPIDNSSDDNDTMPPNIVEPIKDKNVKIDFQGATAGEGHETYGVLDIRTIESKLIAKDRHSKSLQDAQNVTSTILETERERLSRLQTDFDALSDEFKKQKGKLQKVERNRDALQQTLNSLKEERFTTRLSKLFGGLAVYFQKRGK